MDRAELNIFIHISSFWSSNSSSTYTFYLKILTKLNEICILVFFISCFTISITSSINTPESSNYFMILIISFTSLFEMNKVNPFPALAALFPLIFLSNLFIAFEFEFLTNPGKLSLAKGIATFVSASFWQNYPTRNQKIHLIELFWIFELY